jgi:hypothetical protein
MLAAEGIRRIELAIRRPRFPSVNFTLTMASDSQLGCQGYASRSRTSSGGTMFLELFRDRTNALGAKHLGANR